MEPNCLKVISSTVAVVMDAVELLLLADFLAGRVFDLLICNLCSFSESELDSSESNFSYTDWQLLPDPRLPYFLRESK